MKNIQISVIFRDIAKILEIKSDNPFRVRAYERAAQNIEALADNKIEELLRKDMLRDIPGIGADIENKIKEIIETGKLRFYEDLRKTIPEGVLDLVNIPTVGPKTAALLYKKLKIRSILGLERAIKNNKLKNVFGIKEKTLENILKGIELIKRGRERMLLAQAIQVADRFIAALKKMPEVRNISCAGSLRRRKETIRDIDILAASNNPAKVMGVFTGLPEAGEVLAKGATKSSLRTKDDIQVDCRVVGNRSFGAALLYFTGSKNFNIKLRALAQRQGLKINEYGIFRKGKYVAGKTEEGIFKSLGMPYIEPELREDNGEIELAQEARLPQLIEAKDIKGDLHVHSRWSDGKNTIQELAAESKKRGYSYIAVTDHSQGLKIAGGLSYAELKKKKQEINRINKKLKNFRVLYAAEVDIDSYGKLDYSDEVLKEFDLVVAAIHTGFKQSRAQLTRRLINACRNEYAHIIAHPTGRLFGTRDAYDLDFESILKTARDTNTNLEINAFFQRMDLNDANCRLAKEHGVRIAIGTDAHATGHLGAMSLGVSIARRGWLSRENVINTLSVEELLKAIRK